MVYDMLENASQYSALGAFIKKGLTFLQSANFAALPDGPCKIDGQNVFANISTYVAQPPADILLEGHRNYIDLQYIIKGTELVYVGFLPYVREKDMYNPEKDIAFFTGPAQALTLHARQFLLLFPKDVHAPGLLAGDARTVRKAVVKIRVEAGKD